MARHESGYNQLKYQHQEFLQAMEELGDAACKAGPVFERTACLIQLAAAAALRSPEAVRIHVARALEAGASSEEVHHAIILVTGTIGFPSVVAALGWADEVIRRQRAPSADRVLSQVR